MICRWLRAVACSAVIFFGWSGVAAAQAGSYNFAFSPTANGLSGGGVITIDSALRVTSISNFTINGATYLLDTSQSFSSNPTLMSTSPGSLFAQISPNFLYVSSTGSSDTGFSLNNNGTGDYVTSIANGTAFSQSPIFSESFTAVPAPQIGGGALSWIIALFGLAGLAWRTRRRPRLVPASGGLAPLAAC